MAGVWVNTVTLHFGDRSMLVGLMDGSGGEGDGSQPYRVHYTSAKHFVINVGSLTETATVYNHWSSI